MFFGVYGIEKGSYYHQGHYATHGNALNSFETRVKYVCLGAELQPFNARNVSQSGLIPAHHIEKTQANDNNVHGEANKRAAAVE